MNWYKKASSFNGDLLDSLVDNLGPEIGGSLTRDVSGEISKMGIEYRFENIGAFGIAKNDVCIISSRSLTFKPANLLFTLFHELAHYYQYKKYGNDFALSLYTNPTTEIDNDAHFLETIEGTADKFSRLKTTYYLTKYGIKDPITMSGYKGASVWLIKDYLLKIKEMVKKEKFTTISEINEYIYNSIKLGKL